MSVLLVVAGCRLHFDDLPADATADAPPLALACNTPIKILDVPTAAAPKLTAAATRDEIVVAWIDDSTRLVTGGALFTAPDQVIGNGPFDSGNAGYTQVSLAATPDVALAVYAATGNVAVRLFNPVTSVGLSAPMPTTIQVTSPRAAAAIGNASGNLFAFTGNDTASNRAMVAGVDANANLAAPVDNGNVNTLSTIYNVGDRLAIVENPAANTCEIRTADRAVTSVTTTNAWGASGSCSQAALAYSPGRSDALLIRHDITDGDLNHVVATRNGNNYTIPLESRLRNPGNEPRGIGVADGYWVSYETGGTIEAAHISFTGVVGTVVPLGPLSATTAHETVVKDGEPYAIWLQDGLELAHLCP